MGVWHVMCACREGWREGGGGGGGGGGGIDNSGKYMIVCIGYITKC